MGRVLIGLLLAAGLYAQPVPVIGFGSVASGFAWNGPKTIYPGHTAYFLFQYTKWRVPVTCSASGNTCDTAGSGYTPSGSETNVWVTATIPPVGMDTMQIGSFAPYDICNVSGTVFKLCHQGTATVQSFSSTGTSVSLIFVPSSGTSNGYIISNTGWPSGTTISWGYTNSRGLGWLQDAFVSANSHPIVAFSNGASLVMKVDIPSNAAAGDYTINITDCNADVAGGTCTGGRSDTLTFTETVVALTYLSDANEPTSFPAIPGFSSWVSLMTDATNGGVHWCDKTTGVTNPTNQLSSLGNGANVQFYDGGLVYHRIGVYLVDPAWENCSQNIQEQMGWGNSFTASNNPSSYIIANNGSIQGFQLFPAGFQVGAAKDPRNIGPLQYLSSTMNSNYGGPQGTAWAGSGCSPFDSDLRENSYGFELILTIDRMGLTPTNDYPGTPPANTWAARRQRCADDVIGMVTTHQDGSKRFNEDQYYLDGLALHALIHWWQVTKDPRVPIVVKGELDQYYSNYNVSLHRVMWDPEPNGPRCANTLTWWISSSDSHCRDNTSINTNDLANLFSYAFAWYWRISGDDVYRTEGDEIFSHAQDNVGNFVLGKTFSQYFRYSFDYVGWRQGWLSPERSLE